MPRPNTIKKFTVEVIVYKCEIVDPVSNGKAYVYINASETGIQSNTFQVCAEYSPYHSATFYDKASGGQLLTCEVTDQNGIIVTDDFLQNHYTETNSFNSKTKKVDQKFVTLYDYIWVKL